MTRRRDARSPLILDGDGAMQLIIDAGARRPFLRLDASRCTDIFKEACVCAAGVYCCAYLYRKRVYVYVVVSVSQLSGQKFQVPQVMATHVDSTFVCAQSFCLCERPDGLHSPCRAETAALGDTGFRTRIRNQWASLPWSSVTSPSLQLQSATSRPFSVNALLL